MTSAPVLTKHIGFTVRVRLFALAVLVLVGFAVLIAMALTEMDKVKIGGPLYEQIRSNRQLIQRLAQLRADLGDIRVLSVTARHTIDAEELGALRRENVRLALSVDAQFAEAVATPTHDEIRFALASAMRTWAHFVKTDNEVFEAIALGRVPATPLAEMQKLQLERFTDQIDSAVHSLSLRSDELSDEARIGAAQRVRVVLLGGLALALAVLAVTVGVAQSISAPLKHLASACSRLAGGDLTTRAEVLGSQELVQVATAFNTMADEVRSAIDRSRAAEAELRRIFDSTSDGILLVARDGKIIAANRRAEELFSFAPEAVLGKNFVELMRPCFATPKQYAAAAAALASLLDRVDAEESGDVRLAALGRTLRWSARSAKDDAGAGTGVTMTFQDVTSERTAERLRSDFVSFATHQLCTPLSGVKWLLELAAQEPDIPDEPRSYIEDARASAQRLIDMVNDLLDISRLEGGRLNVTVGPVSIIDITRGVFDDLRALAAAKSIKFSMTGPDGGTAVLADTQLLRQVILNLSSNAIKYTPDGGAVAIRIREDADGVRWEVQDTGIGIPEAAGGKLFEKFYRADNVTTLDTEGTGLGLYLVRLVVDKLGGRVSYESVEGCGTTFFFTLPCGR